MPNLSSIHRARLLELARLAIKTLLETGDHLSLKGESPELKIPRGCFITLHKDKELRGCIGTFDAVKPLDENTVRMAISAATQDHRFPKLEKSELDQVKITVSILGNLELVTALDQIEIGRHGVYVKLGDRWGTLLADAAVEHKWLVPEFVMHCARQKAGLSPEECSRAEIFRYEVESFSE